MKRRLLVCSFIFMFFFPSGICLAQDFSKWNPVSVDGVTYLGKVVKNFDSIQPVDVVCLIKPSKTAEDVGGIGKFEQYFAKYYFQYSNRDENGDENEAIIQKGFKKHQWWSDWESQCGKVPWEELQYYFIKK